MYDSAPSSKSVDLRQRKPDPEKCLPHPDCCENCAWGIVSETGPGYQPGQPIPDGLTELAGSYVGNCGPVKLMMTGSGEVGAIRNGRFYPARPDKPAFVAYLGFMGLEAA